MGQEIDVGVKGVTEFMKLSLCAKLLQIKRVNFTPGSPEITPSKNNISPNK